MNQTTKVTKYFCGLIELRGGFQLERAKVMAQFPDYPIHLIRQYDSFNFWVGTIDGKYSTTNFLPVTRIIRYNTAGSKHNCDGRCLNAKRGTCECACGGKNHGAGR